MELVWALLWGKLNHSWKKLLKKHQMERGLLDNCPFFSVIIVQIFMEVFPPVSDYVLPGDYKE